MPQNNNLDTLEVFRGDIPEVDLPVFEGDVPDLPVFEGELPDDRTLGEHLKDKGIAASGALPKGFYGAPLDAMKWVSETLVGRDFTGRLYQDPLGALAVKLEEYLDDLVYIPKSEKDSFVTNVFQGLGQVSSMALVGNMSGAAQASGQLLNQARVATSSPAIAAGKEIVKHMTSPTGVYGSAQMSHHGFTRALEDGATDRQAYIKALVDFGIGATEAIPIGRALDRLNDVTKGGLTKSIISTGQGFIDESVQETMQEWLSNIAEKNIYNEGIDLFSGLTEAGLVGGTVGAIFNLALSALPGSNPELRRLKRDASQMILDKIGEYEGEFGETEATIKLKDDIRKGRLKETSIHDPDFEEIAKTDSDLTDNIIDNMVDETVSTLQDEDFPTAYFVGEHAVSREDVIARIERGELKDLRIENDQELEDRLIKKADQLKQERDALRKRKASEVDARKQAKAREKVGQEVREQATKKEEKPKAKEEKVEVKPKEIKSLSSDEFIGRAKRGIQKENVELTSILKVGEDTHKFKIETQEDGSQTYTKTIEKPDGSTEEVGFAHLGEIRNDYLQQSKAIRDEEARIAKEQKKKERISLKKTKEQPAEKLSRAQKFARGLDEGDIKYTKYNRDKAAEMLLKKEIEKDDIAAVEEFVKQYDDLNPPKEKIKKEEKVEPVKVEEKVEEAGTEIDGVFYNEQQLREFAKEPVGEEQEHEYMLEARRYFRLKEEQSVKEAKIAKEKKKGFDVVEKEENRFDVVLDGEKVGFADIDYHKDSDEASIGGVELFTADDNRRGTGYGRKLYQKLINIAASKGKRLISDFGNQTVEARKVWDGLVRSGEATVQERNGEYRYESTKLKKKLSPEKEVTKPQISEDLKEADTRLTRAENMIRVGNPIEQIDQQLDIARDELKGIKDKKTDAYGYLKNKLDELEKTKESVGEVIEEEKPITKQPEGVVAEEAVPEAEEVVEESDEQKAKRIEQLARQEQRNTTKQRNRTEAKIVAKALLGKNIKADIAEYLKWREGSKLPSMKEESRKNLSETGSKFSEGQKAMKEIRAEFAKLMTTTMGRREVLESVLQKSLGLSQAEASEVVSDVIGEKKKRKMKGSSKSISQKIRDGFKSQRIFRKHGKVKELVEKEWDSRVGARGLVKGNVEKMTLLEFVAKHMDDYDVDISKIEKLNDILEKAGLKPMTVYIADDVAEIVGNKKNYGIDENMGGFFDPIDNIILIKRDHLDAHTVAHELSHSIEGFAYHILTKIPVEMREDSVEWLIEKSLFDLTDDDVKSIKLYEEEIDNIHKYTVRYVKDILKDYVRGTERYITQKQRDALDFYFADSKDLRDALDDYIDNKGKASRDYEGAFSKGDKISLPDILYGLIDPHEIVAEAVSNYRFAAVLASIPNRGIMKYGPRNISESVLGKIFENVRRFIRDVFGGNFKIEGSVLEEVLEASVTAEEVLLGKTGLEEEFADFKKFVEKYKNKQESIIAKSEEKFKDDQKNAKKLRQKKYNPNKAARVRTAMDVFKKRTGKDISFDELKKLIRNTNVRLKPNSRISYNDYMHAWKAYHYAKQKSRAYRIRKELKLAQKMVDQGFIQSAKEMVITYIKKNVKTYVNKIERKKVNDLLDTVNAAKDLNSMYGAIQQARNIINDINSIDIVGKFKSLQRRMNAKTLPNNMVHIWRAIKRADSELLMGDTHLMEEIVELMRKPYDNLNEIKVWYKEYIDIYSRDKQVKLIEELSKSDEQLEKEALEKADEKEVAREKLAKKQADYIKRLMHLKARVMANKAAILENKSETFIEDFNTLTDFRSEDFATALGKRTDKINLSTDDARIYEKALKVLLQTGELSQDAGHIIPKIEASRIFDALLQVLKGQKIKDIGFLHRNLGTASAMLIDMARWNTPVADAINMAVFGGLRIANGNAESRR
jgi:GNAT superfamily N-acetyltransferase